MTITITLNEFEMTAPSQESLGAGWDWCNSPETSKQDMIDFCAAHGEDILEGDGNTLVDEWAEIAAITYANHKSAQ
tara:strand:- start:433 stop:660 length:228 start_codon:yes stop_codon:yes gene_type:complete